MFERFGKILTPLAIIVAGALITGAFLFTNRASQENLLPPQEAGEKAINYINQNMLQEGLTASLIDVVEDGDLYKIRIKIGDNSYESYVSQDGKYLFPEGYDLNFEPQASEEGSSGESSTVQEVPQKEKPDVKVFVMSYCPYGLQAQKMFLPVYDLLKEKAEMGIYFVNYIMHEKQEIDENLRQYCIQKEEKEKYYDYLLCFVKDGDSEGCLTEANIDKTKLGNCISVTDKEYSIYSQYEDKSTWLNGNFPKFDIHDELNETYGVRGSPTVVINDQVVQINPRSPERFKETICQAFTSEPEECSQTLSDVAFDPGFGLEAGGGGSGGGCGP